MVNAIQLSETPCAFNCFHIVFCVFFAGSLRYIYGCFKGTGFKQTHNFFHLRSTAAQSRGGNYTFSRLPRLRAQLHGASGVQRQMLLALQEVLHATEQLNPLVLCSLLWGQRLAKYLKFQVQRISAYGHLVEFRKKP